MSTPAISPLSRLPQPRPLPERSDVDAAVFAREIEPACQPMVFRGLAASWPAVTAARRSAADLVAYLKEFDRGAPVEAFVGPPAMRGRYFYGDDMRGFNFERRKGGLSAALDLLVRASGEAEPHNLYIGAAPVPQILPGFESANPMTLFPSGAAVPRAWIGNRSTVAPHIDLSDNIAVVGAGRRRFTLFPPEQLANLYVGPLDHTMAGQPASLVALDAPDLERFPRFAEAMAAALSAELEPGDAIYIPTLWWHHVEARDPINLLVNYWVDPPVSTDSPFDAMIHAILAISTLPEPRRAAWRSFFDHYVFRPERHPAEHLPPEHRGILGEPTLELRQRMRDFVLRGLGRR